MQNTLLKITAKLANSFLAVDPWSPSIDSILAYYQLMEKLGQEEFTLQASRSDTLTTVDDLPIEKEIYSDLWWWKCSSPQYKKRGEFLTYFHRRFDILAAETYMKPQKGRVQTKAGPFKNFRAPFRTIVTSEVIWYVIGDQKEIERLLSRCRNIGAKIGSGMGRVLKWTVENEKQISTDIARFERPLPIEFGKEYGFSDRPVFDWGFRPAFRIPENKILCYMPQ